MLTVNDLQNLERDENGRLILDSMTENVDYLVKEEDKGKRRKRWFSFSDNDVLVKEVKEDTFEDYAELLVEQLCRQVGLPSAHYDLATYQGRPCVITEKFIKKKTEKLLSGKIFMEDSLQYLEDNELYFRKSKGDQKELNNLEMIEQCLAFYLSDEKAKEVMKSFDMLFALNCFCYNGDIHLSNWSVIYDYKADPSYRMAPNYDAGGYFHFNLNKGNIFKHARNLMRQTKMDQKTKILEDQMFGKDYNKHNGLNYKYTSTDELGLTRLEEAFRAEPERFAPIFQKLMEIDPYEAIIKVEKQLGVKSLPGDCIDWFVSVIEASQERLSYIVNSYYFPKESESSYGV